MFSGEKDQPRPFWSVCSSVRSGLGSRASSVGTRGLGVPTKTTVVFVDVELPSTLPGDTAGLPPITTCREEGLKALLSFAVFYSLPECREALGLLSGAGSGLSSGLSVPKDQRMLLPSPPIIPQDSSLCFPTVIPHCPGDGVERREICFG